MHCRITIDGDPHNDHILQLIDYMANPTIEMKNYLVFSDIDSAVERFENSMNLFKICMKKIKKLATDVYKP